MDKHKQINKTEQKIHKAMNSHRDDISHRQISANDSACLLMKLTGDINAIPTNALVWMVGSRQYQR